MINGVLKVPKYADPTKKFSGDYRGVVFEVDDSVYPPTKGRRLSPTWTPKAVWTSLETVLEAFWKWFHGQNFHGQKKMPFSKFSTF